MLAGFPVAEDERCRSRHECEKNFREKNTSADSRRLFHTLATPILLAKLPGFAAGALVPFLLEPEPEAGVLDLRFFPKS